MMCCAADAVQQAPLLFHRNLVTPLCGAIWVYIYRTRGSVRGLADKVARRVVVADPDLAFVCTDSHAAAKLF